LKQAQEYLGRNDRLVYVAADVYQMPFKAGVFDAITMIRVLHHIANIEEALREIRRTTSPRGTFLLEHASKRHMKSMVRYWMKRQSWNPFDHHPVEFVELNFDFHPEHVKQALTEVGFDVKRRIPVSLLRLPLLKERVPIGVLAGIDALFQETGLLVTPSVFVRAEANDAAPNSLAVEDIFCCPRCGGSLIVDDSQQLVCENDGLRWQVRDGIYDFKTPLNGD
jgi:SAM-dependent methyltransferase